jgi:hypothetical protein
MFIDPLGESFQVRQDEVDGAVVPAPGVIGVRFLGEPVLENLRKSGCPDLELVPSDESILRLTTTIWLSELFRRVFCSPYLVVLGIDLPVILTYYSC